MPRKPIGEKPVDVRPGQAILAIYVSRDLRQRLESRVKELARRGVKATLKSEMVQALERHLAYPPPLPDVKPVPLPDAPKRGRGRPKKESGNNSAK